jgi:mRNA-degrading endonuclease YafQ of YafQ-DinJ toxin-antitoxin module
MYSLSWTNTFLKTSRKFLKKHPDIKPLFIDLLSQLQNDPFQERLRLNALRGRHADKHAVSLTYSYRIIITVQIVQKEIVLLDIGSHDEVYGH